MTKGDGLQLRAVERARQDGRPGHGRGLLSGPSPLPAGPGRGRAGSPAYLREELALVTATTAEVALLAGRALVDGLGEQRPAQLELGYPVGNEVGRGGDTAEAVGALLAGP